MKKHELVEQIEKNFLQLDRLCKSPTGVFLPNSKEANLLSQWIEKMNDIECTSLDILHLRNRYYSNLLMCLLTGEMFGPFRESPPDGPLEDYDFMINIQTQHHHVIKLAQEKALELKINSLMEQNQQQTLGSMEKEDAKTAYDDLSPDLKKVLKLVEGHQTSNESTETVSDASLDLSVRVQCHEAPKTPPSPDGNAPIVKLETIEAHKKKIFKAYPRLISRPEHRFPHTLTKHHSKAFHIKNPHILTTIEILDKLSMCPDGGEKLIIINRVPPVSISKKALDSLNTAKKIVEDTKQPINQQATKEIPLYHVDAILKASRFAMQYIKYEPEHRKLEWSLKLASQALEAVRFELSGHTKPDCTPFLEFELQRYKILLENISGNKDFFKKFEKEATERAFLLFTIKNEYIKMIADRIDDMWELCQERIPVFSRGNHE